MISTPYRSSRARHQSSEPGGTASETSLARPWPARAGAIACHRHTRSLLVTAAVDGLQFLNPIKVGDLIILQARVTATFRTSLEVQVEVFSEGTLSGERKLTSRAYLTFVAIDARGGRVAIPQLLLETDDDRARADEAAVRRAARLEAKRRFEQRQIAAQ